MLPRDLTNTNGKTHKYHFDGTRSILTMYWTDNNMLWLKSLYYEHPGICKQGVSFETKRQHHHF